MSIIPIFETRYSATDISRDVAKVCDDAWKKGGVEILREAQRFVLLRQEYFEKLVEDQQASLPKDLGDLLLDYDAKKISSLTQDFLAAPAAGRELI